MIFAFINDIFGQQLVSSNIVNTQSGFFRCVFAVFSSVGDFCGKTKNSEFVSITLKDSGDNSSDSIIPSDILSSNGDPVA